MGTAEDYWRLAQMMGAGGELNGVRLLSPQTMEYMPRDHLGGIPIEQDAPEVWYQKRDLVVVALVQEWGMSTMAAFWPEARPLVYSAPTR